MLRNEFAAHIDRPVQEVFAFVTDLPRTPEWRTTVLRAEAIQWQAVSPVGAHFRAITRVAGRRWNWVLEVTAWDPPGRFAYVVEGSVPMEVFSLDGLRLPIPNHREIAEGTARSILRQAAAKLGEEWWT